MLRTRREVVMSHGGPSGPLDRLLPPVTVAVLGFLLLALGVGVAPNFDTRLVNIGEQVWPGYAKDLRSDPTPPECELEALQQRLAACPAEAETNGDETGGDPFGGEDPFAEADGGDPFGGADPFAEADGSSPDAVPAADDPFGDVDPFVDPAPPSDPFAGADPFAPDNGDAGSADPSDPFAGGDPFADGPAAPTEENCPALRALAERCEKRHAAYADTIDRLTPGVRRFRSVETAVSDFARFDYWKHLLSLLLLLGALATTVRRQHIALREPETGLEHRVTQALQLVVHIGFVASAWADWQVGRQGAAEVEHPLLPLIWAAGFGALAAVNLFHIIKVPTGLKPGFRVVRLLTSIPLYVYMGVVALVYFQFLEGHDSGQAIYLHKFVQHPSIYIGIGLYIWAGMMLSETRLAQRVFDVLLPWKLPPAILAWLVVVLAAVPTAYSGASGIFVIAAGAVVFHQLKKAGASPRLALSATAMSGSLGVVLRPCLVVVLVAILNKQVTTDELFGRGFQVFLLTALLYLGAMLLRNRDGFSLAPVSEGMAGMLRGLKRLAPYGLVGTGVLAFQSVVLDTQVSEHTAAFMLPAILIALVVFDTRFKALGAREDDPERLQAVPERAMPALTRATHESSGHIGALLMLMAGSVGLGGVVERAELMSLVPQDLGSPVAAMGILVVAMVLVGMTMDALGAVVLVSVTIAPLAYKNGIDPVHFWMMVLVAFELGYLTPPVAINHLLARQVIGDAARVEDIPVDGGWVARNEHLWLPMAVMGTALVIVAFVPFLIG
ncbi:MAG: TRAP transporter large permease subunit [Myxococcota bacterium]|nr:TRAP transporter large permease subunit [Myxococcota bacterium]